VIILSSFAENLDIEEIGKSSSKPESKIGLFSVKSGSLTYKIQLSAKF